MGSPVRPLTSRLAAVRDAGLGRELEILCADAKKLADGRSSAAGG